MRPDIICRLLALLFTGALLLPAAGLADDENDDANEAGEEVAEEVIEDEIPEEEVDALGDMEPLPEAREPAEEEALTAEEEETLREEALPEEEQEDAEELAPEVPSPERTLTLLVHPVFPPAQAEQVFQPMADFLEETTPYELELVTPRDFHQYWLDARRGDQPHLVLEDAHMAAWRMDRFDYLPIVRSDTPEQYSLLTSEDYEDDELEDFVARRISTLPAPSLGYVVLANWFPNPMQQPRMESTAQSWMDAVEIIFAFEADAAMVPRSLVERYPNLYPVEASEELPGLTLSVSPAIGEEIIENLVTALLEMHESEEHFGALYELDLEQFEPAEPEEYDGLDDLLEVLFAM